MSSLWGFVLQLLFFVRPGLTITEDQRSIHLDTSSKADHYHARRSTEPLSKFFRREKGLSAEGHSLPPAALGESKQCPALQERFKKASLEAWVKWPSDTDPDRINIIGGANDGTCLGRGLYLLRVSDATCASSGKTSYAVHLGSTDTGTGSSTNCFTPGDWVHVAAVKHCGANIDFYVNGVNSQGTMSGACPLIHIDGTLGDANVPTQKLYNVRIWKTNLTGDETRCFANTPPTGVYDLDLDLMYGFWWMKESTAVEQNTNYAADAATEMRYDCQAGCSTKTCGGSDASRRRCSCLDATTKLPGTGTCTVYSTGTRFANTADIADIATVYNGFTNVPSTCSSVHNELDLNPTGCDDDWGAAHIMFNDFVKDATEDPDRTCCIGDTGCPNVSSTDGVDPFTQCTYVDIGSTPRGSCCNFTQYCELMEGRFGSTSSSALQIMETKYHTGGGPSRESARKSLHRHVKIRKTPNESGRSFAQESSTQAKIKRATAGQVRSAATTLEKTMLWKGEEESDGPGCAFSEKTVKGRDGKDLVQTSVGSKAKDKAETQEMIFEFPEADYETGSLTVPPGFVKEYSTDDGDTWHDQEPLTGVNKIRALGTFPPGPGAVFPMPPVSAAAIDTRGGGGDGSTTLFLRNEVYLFYHHTKPAAVVCINSETGAGCTGFPTPKWVPVPSAGTNNLPVGMATSFNNMILVPAHTGECGFICFIVEKDTAPELCNEGDAKDGWIGFPGEGHQIGHGGAHPGISKVFAIAHKGSPKIFCAQADATKCQGFPYDAGIGKLEGVRPLHNVPKVIVYNGATSKCIDVGEDGPKDCDGWAAGGNYKGLKLGGVMPIQDSRGFSIGYCLFSGKGSGNFHCMDVEDGGQANEEVKGAQTAIRAQIDSPSVPIKEPTCWLGYFGSSGTRSYAGLGNTGNTKSALCYDGSTKDTCRNYPFTDSLPSYLYTIEPSKKNDGNCIWRLGCAGQLKSFSARRPTDPCGSASPVITLDPTSAVCHGDEGGSAWESATLINVEDGDFEVADLVVKDLAGKTLKEETLGKPGALVTVDLKEYDIADDTQTLEFHIVFTKLDEAIYSREIENMPSLDVRWVGQKPKVCVESGTAPKTTSGQNSCEAKAIHLANLSPALLLTLLSLVGLFPAVE